MGGFSQIHPTNLRDQVIEQVRNAIIEGRLRSRDHIIEKQLTDQLGVSRTPVREALILLEREGLITSIPNRGFFVRVFSEEDVDHIFTMRAMLENFAGKITLESDTTIEIDLDYLNNSIDSLQKHIAEDNFVDVRRTDMDFHRYLIKLSRHPLIMRNWLELVAQIAALLHLRASVFTGYDEGQIIQDHRDIFQAYAQSDLDRLLNVNDIINRRVSEECRQAVKEWGN